MKNCSSSCCSPCSPPSSNQHDNQHVIWNTEHQSKVSDDVFNILYRESRNADVVKSSYHAAAVVYKGRILAVGLNKRKTHPTMKKFQKNHRPNRIYLHAEVDAIIRTINLHGEEILKSSDLYVLRTTKSGKIGTSEPCNGCRDTINFYQLKHVYWT